MELGPIFGIFFNWQTLLLVLVTYYMTHGFKRLIDFAAGGEEKRKQIRWITLLVLPGLPSFVGGVLGVLVPFRPETLVNYRPQHWGLYVSWGISVGLGADLVYQKIQHYLRAKSLPGLPAMEDRPSIAPAPPVVAPKPIEPAKPADPAPPPTTALPTEMGTSVETQAVADAVAATEGTPKSPHDEA